MKELFKNYAAYCKRSAVAMVRYSARRAIRPARFLAAATAGAVLAGCAIAPGMQMHGTFPGASGSPSNSASKVAAGPAVATPQLEAITPDAILRMRQARPRAAEGLQDLIGKPGPYKIGPGDVLGIIVWEHPELATPPLAVSAAADGTATANGYVVDAEGHIQFAYTDRLKVAGLTDAQARDTLVAALGKTLRKPQVTLRVQSYRSQRVYLDGEVRSPGVQAITDMPMTLPEALNRAGGATASGDTSRLQLSRNGTTTRINLPALVAAGVNPSDLLLKHGDLLRVPGKDESKIYVIGEVQKPGSLTLRNGRLSLNEALGEAAGVNPVTGNAAQIYVVRTTEAAQASATSTVYHLDARSPVALMLAEQFELQARDVVYVDPAPLATWNRVISLILPSASLVNTTNNALK